MMMNNYIKVDSYEKMFGPSWSGKDIPDSGIVYTTTESVFDFFNICKQTTNKYILVTACSDFGVFYQQEFHPNEDLIKMTGAIQWDTILKERKHYWDVTITSRKPNKCHPAHKFSLKCDRFTEATFDEIPNNVLMWFSTNVNVFEDRICFIPFGQNSGTTPECGCNIIHKYVEPWDKKLSKIYVSFQDYTQRRIQLKGLFSKVSEDIVTFRANVGLPVDKFYEEVAAHKYILVPWGNGCDSYRIYESMILGSIPILENCRFSRYLEYHGLPVIIVNNFERLPTFDKLEEMYQNNLKHRSLEKITEKYWFKKISGYKDKLL